MNVFRLLALSGCLLFAFSSSALARDLRGSSDYPFADESSAIYPHEVISQLIIQSAGSGDVVVDDNGVVIEDEPIEVVECNGKRITLRICLPSGSCLTVEKDRRTGNVTFRYDHDPDSWYVPIFTFKLICDEEGNCYIEDALGFPICDVTIIEGVVSLDCSYLGQEGNGDMWFNEDGKFCFRYMEGGESCIPLNPEGHPIAPLLPYILPFGPDFWPEDWPNRDGDETDICEPFMSI